MAYIRMDDAGLPDFQLAELLVCEACGGLVHPERTAKHDDLHMQVEGLISTTWRHTDLLDGDAQQLEEHADRIAHVQDQIGDLESKTYRLDDAVRNVDYRVDDAVRTAERAADAAASASRGW